MNVMNVEHMIYDMIFIGLGSSLRRRIEHRRRGLGGNSTHLTDAQ